MPKIKKYELLSPAGSLEKARYAFAFGADAVYLGVPDFSLRVRINTFTKRDIEDIISYAHEKRKKVYVTVNIYAHNRHLRSLPSYLRWLAKVYPDALIVSDPGVITLAKKYCPGIPLHLSTQANCTNWEAARFWRKQGVERIILARELTLDEIKEIHKKVPLLELEYFVHGAMCMSYSGRCLLSSFLAGRSANLGDCVQPCRWSYNLKRKNDPDNFLITAEGHEDKSLELEEDIHGTYLLNSKDLCLVKHIDKLKEAGVTSFKIEGRAKSVYYVALVTKVYRQALDFQGSSSEKRRLLNKLFSELKTLIHRDYTTGFLLGKRGEQKTDKSHLVSSYQFVGEVIEIKKSKINKNGMYVKVHNALFVGDRIEIIESEGPIKRIKIKKMYSLDGEELKEAHGGQNLVVFIPVSQKITSPAVLRKKI